MMNVGHPPQTILTVSDLTQRIREQLEGTFSDLWVEGEISNLRRPSSGHVYLTLKDPRSQIRAVLFRSQAQRVQFELQEGLMVLVRGRVTVYDPRGDYQLVLECIEPKGIGALQIQFEQLKKKLEKEGLFDASRKRELPLLPKRVGVVTSASGAALRDILSVIRRRCPILGVVIVPVPVQGEGAGEKIAEAIHDLDRSRWVDVMIVGRGGGSWEDLWSFNDEVVVRAIAAASVPVVSAVGHEIDFTLADFAADYRAETPTAAAEVVAPPLNSLAGRLNELWMRLEKGIQDHCAALREQALSLYREKSLVQVRILQQAQHVDDLTECLVRSFRDSFAQKRHQTVTGHHALQLANPLIRLRQTVVTLRHFITLVPQHMRKVLLEKRRKVEHVMTLLDSLSPLAILGRGYSILQTLPELDVVRDAEDVSIGQELRATLGKGRLLCSVRKRSPDATSLDPSRSKGIKKLA